MMQSNINIIFRSTLTLWTSKCKSYSLRKTFRIQKLTSGFQIVRSIIPLPHGRVTTLRIKLLQGFIFIFGVATNTTNIAS